MPNRTLCAVLEEMRKAYETRNFSYLIGLVEEAQSMGNRMESKLWDQKDFERAKEDHSRIKAELKELKKERESLAKPDSKEDSLAFLDE